MSILKHFINKSLAISHLGKKWISELCSNIYEASRTVSYVETVSNKADTLHKNISYSEEKILKQSFEVELRKVLKKLKIKKVQLAIDGKKDLYYGKNGGLSVRGIKYEHGSCEAWEYIVVSIISPIHIPLMAVRYWQGADLANCCIELLDFAKSLPLKIEKVLFDRGFFNTKLIDYLESKKTGKPLPYIIFVPQNSKVKKYISQVDGNFGSFDYEMKYYYENYKRKPTTKIVICKKVGQDRKGKFYDWVFATNLKPSYLFVKMYRKRWNIETGFRVMEEGKIKSRSNNKLIRFFYFLLRALLVVIWTVNRYENRKLTFKKFLREGEYFFYKIAKTRPPPNIIVFT